MRVFAGARARLEHADRRAVLAGWIAGYTQRVKRFPTLQQLLGRRGGARQSLEEQARVMERVMQRSNRRKE